MTSILQLTTSQFWDKPKVLLVQTRLQAAKRTWSSPGIFFFSFFKQTKQLKVCVNLLKCSLCQLIIAGTENNADYCSLPSLHWRRGRPKTQS